MRRTAFIGVVTGGMLACGWLALQPGVDLRAPSARHAPLPLASDAAAATPMTQQIASATAENAATTQVYEQAELVEAAARSDARAMATPTALVARGNAAAALRATLRRCLGEAEALKAISNTTAGWDVAVASTALQDVARDNNSCGAVQSALDRARDVVAQTVATAAPAAEATKTQATRRGSPPPVGDGDAIGGNGGPGYLQG